MWKALGWCFEELLHAAGLDTLTSALAINENTCFLSKAVFILQRWHRSCIWMGKYYKKKCLMFNVTWTPDSRLGKPLFGASLNGSQNCCKLTTAGNNACFFEENFVRLKRRSNSLAKLAKLQSHLILNLLPHKSNRSRQPLLQKAREEKRWNHACFQTKPVC